jgi:hypothetical protein
LPHLTITKSEQFASINQSGMTEHVPGLPVRTIATSPGLNLDFFYALMKFVRYEFQIIFVYSKRINI